MKPTVLLGSGFIGSPAQQKIVVNKTINQVKPVSEKKIKAVAKKSCKG
ncbi:MAG: hypothetical protein M0R50_05930 [Candidatus Cloacimonetes bacterium]|jgi:saccharopine dehydrogenase-like NADP-dependent oxidoreductase|nr:hypothetical protein [Candidatus Cloacimonadota bacterium]